MTRRIWSPQDLAILENNRKERNFSELSSLLNRSEKAIQLKLCKLKKHCKPKTRPKLKLPNNTEELLRERYLTHSLSELASLLGVSISTVSTTMRRLGLTKTKSLNNSFFNSENLLGCYWAGFLAADGCVRKQKKSDGRELSISLQEKDVNQIIQLKKDIEAYDFDLVYSQRGHNKTGKMTGQYAIYLTISKQCFEDLSNNFSIVPVKSLTLLPPKISNHQNKLAFIKGYIDGDGCIVKHKNSSYVEVSCLGTFELLSWIAKTLNLTNQPLKKDKNNDKNTFRLNIKNSVAKAVKNSIPYRGLERKWDKIG